MSQCKNCGREIGSGARGPARRFCSRAENRQCHNERAAKAMQEWRGRHAPLADSAETRRERSPAIRQTGLEQSVNSYGRSGSNGRSPTYGRRFVDGWRSDSDFYQRQLLKRIEDANGNSPELKEKLRRATEARQRFESKP